jgi:hypothetical protein
VATRNNLFLYPVLSLHSNIWIHSNDTDAIKVIRNEPRSSKLDA